MSAEEAKRLLRRFRIVPNRLLGQNFMVEPTLFERLSEYASVGKADVVLDAGAGFGFLTRFLAGKCRSVIAVEKDPIVAEVLREQLNGLANVVVIEGDMLNAELPEFNKLIAIPPYYLSTRLVTWLLECEIDSAVLVLQRALPRNSLPAWAAKIMVGFQLSHITVQRLSCSIQCQKNCFILNLKLTQ